MSQEYSPPPPGVGIQVVDSPDDRLVIAIPPGGKRARGIGYFAFAWLAITGPVSCVFLMVDDANWDGGEAPPAIFMIPFFGIFWAVGIGMLIAWVRMRFTQIYLAVEREQFAIQKVLFGRKKLKKIPLDETSHAELVESYQENATPVYAIQMEGVDGKTKFGTGLSYEEKRWLATTINRFLGVGGGLSVGDSDSGSLPAFCDDCGSELMIGDGKRVCPDCARVYLDNDADSDSDPASGRRRSGLTDPRGGGGEITERPPVLEPFELPEDSKVRIDVDDGETLAFSYGIQVPIAIKVLVGGFLSVFCFAWFGGVLAFMISAVASDEPIVMRIGITLFGSVFLFAGMMPLGVLLALFFGRARLRMGREEVTGSIGFGFLRKKKTIATESISDVGLAPANVMHRRNGTMRTTGSFAGLKGCMIKSSECNMPLTMSSDDQFNAQVAGLARFQLRRLGVDLVND